MAIIEEKEEDDNNHQSASNRKHHHHRTTELPTEIIVQILFKLPVESLLRCKSVCKLWFSLISDPHFVKYHLKLSAHNNNTSRLLFSTGINILETCCVDDVMMDGGNITINNDLEVVDYPLKGDCKSVKVVGSCNGLLCLYIRMTSDCKEDAADLFIWNPSVKKYHKLPPNGHRWNGLAVSIGFGYDEVNDDYKVVFVFVDTVKMYSLRNGGWKDIGAFPDRLPMGLRGGTFLNGAIHWRYSDRWGIVIVSLDLATETYGEVVQPVYDEGEKEVTLGILGEWLCLMCDYFEGRVDLWVMKVYSVKESWTKLVCVPYTPDPDIFDRYLTPLFISSDGKILFMFGTKLMIYDSNSSSFSDVRNFDEEVAAYTFYESLVSPLPPAAALEHRVEGFNG